MDLNLPSRAASQATLTTAGKSTPIPQKKALLRRPESRPGSAQER
jgi:hypothetical protein